MKSIIKTSFIGAALVAALVGCGPSKPSGSEFLGKWEATSMDKYVCPLVISRNGASFLITVEGEFGGSGAICEEYRGIFTLTPEGNLKGGPMGSTLFFFDQQKNQIAASYFGEVQYLKKR